ncbi:hypothetical protein HER39_07865, partial [Arthrobacter deserti]|nr:hypothetical protein [Arthrobacter deserti]
PGRETINIAGQTVSHAGTYNQTYLPPDPSLAGPAQLQASPDGAFPIVIGSTTTQ